MRLDEKVVASLGRMGSRLLVVGAILYIVARLTGSMIIDRATGLIALTGLTPGALRLLGSITLLRRRGETCYTGD